MKEKLRLEASLTVECALVLPVFTITILVFCSLFRVMELQMTLQKAIQQATKEVASYGYLYQKLDTKLEEKEQELLTGVFENLPLLELFSAYTEPYALKWVTKQYIEEEVIGILPLRDGWKGVDFSGSLLRDTDECVRIQITYRVQLPFTGKHLPSLVVKQASVCRLFCGNGVPPPQKPEVVEEKPEEQKEEIDKVYLTDNAAVYHLDKSCSHLRLIIQTVTYDGIGTRRNNNRGKYYPCERCTEGKTVTDEVFITTEGNRYHIDRTCPGLTRTIQEKTMKDVQGMRACSRCGKKK